VIAFRMILGAAKFRFLGGNEATKVVRPSSVAVYEGAGQAAAGGTAETVLAQVKKKVTEAKEAAPEKSPEEQAAEG